MPIGSFQEPKVNSQACLKGLSHGHKRDGSLAGGGRRVWVPSGWGRLSGVSADSDRAGGQLLAPPCRLLGYLYLWNFRVKFPCVLPFGEIPFILDGFFSSVLPSGTPAGC